MRIVGTEKSTGNVTLQTAENDDYKVTISYDKSKVTNIPDGATVSIKSYDESDSAYKTAKEAYIAAKTAEDDKFLSDGMELKALDISILDENKQEIEPNGKVSVSIEVKNLPDEATSVEVSHIKGTGNTSSQTAGAKKNIFSFWDDEDGETTTQSSSTSDSSVKAEVVASDVAAENGEASATFTVDSFSTFTISYYNGYYTFNRIKVVDTNGNEIGTDSSYSMTSSYTTLSNLGTQANPDSDSYTYQGAKVGTSFANATDATFTYIGFSNSGNGSYWNGDSWTAFGSNQYVYLVYSGGTGAHTASFYHNDGTGLMSTVTSNEDGEITFPEETKTRDGYTFSGWSTDQNANGSGAEHHRARVYQPGETATITANTTYYAIWSENNAGSGFYIRLDGIIPTEPAAAGETENYQNDKYTQGVDVAGALNPAHFYANQNGVDSHLSAQPTADQIVYMINNSTRSIGVNVENQDGKVVVSSITDASTNRSYYNLSVGDEVYVVWYVIKNAGAGPMVGGGNSSYAWHVDGVLLTRSKVNLTYDPNAPTGSFANMPAGSQWNVGDQTVAGNDGGTTAVKEPTRNDGYRFVGWAEYIDTNDDHQFSDDEYVATIATNTSITMNHDVHLVAQWTKGNNFLTVSKTDTNGNVLSGAKFTLEKKEDSGSWTTVQENLTTSSNGTFTYDNVTSQTVYRMTETYAPSGYETRNAFYFEVTTDPDDNILGLYETDENGNVLTGTNKHDWIEVSYTAASGTGGGVAQLHLTIKDEQVKRKVQFIKEDQQGNKLSGAIFTLTDSSNAAVAGVLKTEATGIDGIFSVENATLPYGTYTLTETTAPTNYETLKPITITLNDPSGDAATTDGTYTTGTGMSFSGDDADNASVSMTRTTSTEDNMATTTYTYTVTIKDDSYTNVTVKKVANDADGNRTTTALTGATFTLTRRNDSGNYEVPSPAITGLGTDGSFTISSADGFALNNLPAGTYKLKETAAPSGYIVLTDDIYFSVSAGSVQFTDSTGKALTTNTYPADVEGTTITVGNTAGTALPNTGGPGTNGFLFGGLTMILAAGVVYLISKKRLV